MSKCNCKKDKCLSPAVLQINNHDCPTVFHKVTFPAAMGDDETNPPRNGQYRNVLLVYEANGHVYMFSSDGIPTLISDGSRGIDDYNELTNKPSIEGHELVGDLSLEDIGVTDAIEDALEDYTPTSEFAEVAFTGDYDDLIGTPTIPTVNDATLTIQKEGSSIGTFTANSATNTTINVVETDPTVPSWAKQPTKPTYSYSEITDKPTIPAAQVNSDWNANSGVAQILNKPTLATVATSGSYNDLSNKPTIPAAQVNSDWNAASGVAQILNKPSLATVATSGLYSDLSGTPTIPTKTSDLTNDGADNTSTYVEADELATVATTGAYGDLSGAPSLATVATTGSYADLTNKPTIPTVNDATLTIQRNGTNVQTFTANASSNVTANISVPTKTSDLTNDGASGSSTYVEASALGNYVTLGTNQNITGEKTFVGDKRIKFKGTTSSSKLGFTTYDNTGGETGFLEVQGASNASKKVRLGCYDQNSGGDARDNYVGFQYYNTKPVGGGTISYNLVCPPQYKGVSGANSFAYIPIDFTDGTTTIRAGVNGVLNLSSLLPSSVTVVQTTGQSTTDVMSQKAVTDIIGDIETVLQTLNNGGGAQ